ncbi:hypothetical protein BN946_scf184913.g10 [Trametes cinnabarina]|uniref:Uncharacterized protein n=1 Tax=Pycnoporus cinnabarinus TaxID=5643 RepID=A0A060S1P9_PYCCI|nr:hypothetical protein BN946_scf184913.g10 [Trametes cinnabarina]
MVVFIEPLTAILVASFLSALRKAADARTYQESLSSMGSLEFRVVGSFGANPGENVQEDGIELAETESAGKGEGEGEGEGARAGHDAGSGEDEGEGNGLRREVEADAVVGRSGWYSV